MRLLDKLAFWKKEEPQKISAEDFKALRDAVSSFGTVPRGVTSQFARIVNLVDDIYSEVDKCRTIERQVQESKAEMIQQVRAQQRTEVKGTSQDITRYEKEIPRCKVNIRSLLIKLKVQLDSMAKTSLDTTQSIKQLLKPGTESLGKEVRLSPQIISDLLP